MQLASIAYTFTYGPPLPAGTHPDEARLALQELSAAGVRRRLAERGQRSGWPASIS